MLSTCEALEKMMGDKEMQEKIYIASPVLYEEIGKYLSGYLSDEHERERIRHSFTKYLSRMCTRCTPYGLFASCSSGILGQTTQFEMKSSLASHTRLDMFFLCDLVQTLSKQPDVREKLLYFPNTTLYAVGKMYRYIKILHTGDTRTHVIASVERNKYLDTILHMATDGIDLFRVQNYLQKSDIWAEDILPYIEDLIDSQVLVSELQPVLTGEGYIERILKVLHRIKDKERETTEIKVAIDHVQKVLDEIDRTDTSSVDAYKECVRIFKDIPVSIDEGFLFQVDSGRGAKVAVLGNDVVRELSNAVSFLTKLAHFFSNGALQTFRQAFYARYEDSEIPLNVALDKEMGLGYPAQHGVADISPLIDRLSLPKRETENGNIRVSRILLKKILKAKERGDDEIVLTDEDMEGRGEDSKHAPSTLYSMFQVIGEVDGKPLLNIMSVGESGAKLLSRFSHTDEHIERLVMDIVAFEERRLPPDSIFAEIVHLPSSRVGNILSRPCLRDYEIVYLADSQLPQSQRIYTSDLMLSYRNGKLLLRSKKLDKWIYPRLTNAHNYASPINLPLYRFLCDLQYQQTMPGYSMGFGELGNLLDFRPRIRYKNSIFSPASWTVRKIEFESLYKLRGKDLIDGVRSWREGRKIPEKVVLSEGDNELFVNFQSNLSVESFLSAVKRKNEIILNEFLFDTNNLIVKGKEGDYLHEFIVAFYNDK